MNDARAHGGQTARPLAALAVGLVLGATTAGGTALLLYTGQGFLRAAGLLVASTIMAVAAGIWAGAWDGTGERLIATRARWLLTILALLAGGLFAGLWHARAPLQSLAAGGAVAVLLLLALPAYAAGSLLAGLHARDRARLPHTAAAGVPPAAIAGAATGVLLATTILIQTMDPFGIYFAAAALLSLSSFLDRGRDPTASRTGETAMIDHVTLITGVGGRGQLGYAVARRFLDAGARVVLTSRRPDVHALAEELSPHGRVFGVQADLLDDGAVAQLVDTTRDRFGRLDSLVNIAGGLTVIGSVTETTPEQWHEEIERNAGTALRACRATLPLLRESRGAIVNFASPAVHQPIARLGAYSAAKAAVLALTRTLALEELRSGVRVNAIAPGVMDTATNRSSTGEVPTADHVSLEDVAAVVLFLAGPGAGGVTGETISVTRTTPAS